MTGFVRLWFRFLSVFSGDDVRNACPDFPDEVFGCDFDLQPANTGTDPDFVKSFNGAVDEGREVFFHADRGTSSPDVAGQWQEFFYGDHVAFFVAGGPGDFFEVDFMVAGNDTDEVAGLVAVKHQCLEDLFDVFAQYVGHVSG